MTRFALLAACLCLISPVLAWDGNWTQETSGYQHDDVIYDPKSSHSDAGTPERPQKFFIPPPRDFADVDPEEDGDYKRKDYSPYALARISRAIRLNSVTLTNGYYLIKPDDAGGGSPNTHLQDPTLLQTASSDPVAATGGHAPKSYRVFIIKKLGRVVAVVPIHRKEAYKPPKGAKIKKKQALAWVEEENRHPVLKFYYKNAVYSTDFESGL